MEDHSQNLSWVQLHRKQNQFCREENAWVSSSSVFFFFFSSSHISGTASVWAHLCSSSFSTSPFFLFHCGISNDSDWNHLLPEICEFSQRPATPPQFHNHQHHHLHPRPQPPHHYHWHSTNYNQQFTLPVYLTRHHLLFLHADPLWLLVFRRRWRVLSVLMMMKMTTRISVRRTRNFKKLYGDVLWNLVERRG